ncbi:MAG TPA: hypothetical protein DG753_07710 [Clostridium sp.]|nr:hypothetical protein [Clostridium sp.]
MLWIKKTIHTVVPKEVFGVKIEGNLVPVIDEGQVVGCIACVFSLEEMETLKSTNELMNQTIKESDDSITNILNESNNTVNELKDIYNYVENLERTIQDVYNVVESIKSNTSRTK